LLGIKNNLKSKKGAMLTSCTFQQQNIAIKLQNILVLTKLYLGFAA